MGSAEGECVAEAGDIYVVDCRLHRAMITDELALPVDRAVGSVGDRPTRIPLDVFLRAVAPVAAGGMVAVDASVRVVVVNVLRLGGLCGRHLDRKRRPRRRR